MKEKKCFLSPSPIQDDRFGEERKMKDTYMLPDNSIVDLSYEKQRAPEILFSPERYGLEMPCNS
jgi:centractin